MSQRNPYVARVTVVSWRDEEYCVSFRSSKDSKHGFRYLVRKPRLQSIIDSLPRIHNTYRKLDIHCDDDIRAIKFDLSTDVICNAGVEKVSVWCKDSCILSEDSTICGVPIWDWDKSANRGRCRCRNGHDLHIKHFKDSNGRSAASRTQPPASHPPAPQPPVPGPSSYRTPAVPAQDRPPPASQEPSRGIHDYFLRPVPGRQSMPNPQRNSTYRYVPLPGTATEQPRPPDHQSVPAREPSPDIRHHFNAPREPRQTPPDVQTRPVAPEPRRGSMYSYVPPRGTAREQPRPSDRQSTQSQNPAGESSRASKRNHGQAQEPARKRTRSGHQSSSEAGPSRSSAQPRRSSPVAETHHPYGTPHPKAGASFVTLNVEDADEELVEGGHWGERTQTPPDFNWPTDDPNWPEAVPDWSGEGNDPSSVPPAVPDPPLQATSARAPPVDPPYRPQEMPSPMNIPGSFPDDDEWAPLDTAQPNSPVRGSVRDLGLDGTTVGEPGTYPTVTGQSVDFLAHRSPRRRRTSFVHEQGPDSGFTTDTAVNDSESDTETIRGERVPGNSRRDATGDVPNVAADDGPSAPKSNRGLLSTIFNFGGNFTGV